MPRQAWQTAVSPMTKISGRPGTRRSGPTRTRPAGSASTPSQAAAGEAATPAAHITVRAVIHSPSTSAPVASTVFTLRLINTSTPRAASERSAAFERERGKVGSTRSAACTSTMRAVAGSNARNSRVRPCWASSAIAPASSTPVGPPPTMTKVSQARRSAPPAHSPAGRPPPKNDEGDPTPPLRFVLTALRRLEGKQKTAANVERVLDSFEARRCRCPIVVAEIAVPRTRGDDQEVICKPRLAERDLTQHWVHPGHFGQQHTHVGLGTEHFAQWCRNFCRRQPCRCHLIEQRLKNMIVVVVEKGARAGGLPNPASRSEAAKAAAEDNHVRQAG